MSDYMLQRSKPQAWLYPVLLNTTVVLMFTNCGTLTSDINPSLGFFINEVSTMVPQTMLLGEWSSGSMPDIHQVSLTTTVAFDWHLVSFSSMACHFQCAEVANHSEVKTQTDALCQSRPKHCGGGQQ